MNSKILTILFALLLLGNPLFFSESFSDHFDNSNEKIEIKKSFSDKIPSSVTKDKPWVNIQMVLRDVDGNLVGFVEGHEYYRIRPGLFNPMMDKHPITEIIEANGKEYEILSFYYKTETIGRDSSYPAYTVWAPPGDGPRKPALLVNHEAYMAKPGDTVEVYFNIIRPAS